MVVPTPSIALMSDVISTVICGCMASTQDQIFFLIFLVFVVVVDDNVIVYVFVSHMVVVDIE